MKQRNKILLGSIVFVLIIMLVSISISRNARIHASEVITSTTEVISSAYDSVLNRSNAEFEYTVKVKDSEKLDKGVYQLGFQLFGSTGIYEAPPLTSAEAVYQNSKTLEFETVYLDVMYMGGNAIKVEFSSEIAEGSLRSITVNFIGETDHDLRFLAASGVIAKRNIIWKGEGLMFNTFAFDGASFGWDIIATHYTSLELDN